MYLLVGGLLILISIIFSSDYLKLRYYYQIHRLFIDDNIYFDQYKSGYEVFKEYKFFGVGNKNYRIVSCSKFDEEANKWIDIIGKPSDIPGHDGFEADFFIKKYVEYRCNTHPHQVF